MFAAVEDGNPYLWVALSLLSIPALIVLNGLFVAAEFALVAVRKTRVEELVARGVQGAHAVDAAVRNLSRSIAATQLGVTLSSMFTNADWARSTVRVNSSLRYRSPFRTQ